MALFLVLMPTVLTPLMIFFGKVFLPLDVHFYSLFMLMEIWTVFDGSKFDICFMHRLLGG